MSKKQLLLSLTTLVIFAGLLTLLNSFSFSSTQPLIDSTPSPIPEVTNSTANLATTNSSTDIPQSLITAIPPTPLPAVLVSSQLTPPVVEIKPPNQAPQIIPTKEPVTVPIPQQPVPNQVLITFKPNTTPQERQAYIQQIGGTVNANLAKLNSVVVYLPSQIAGQPLLQSSIIAASEPDYYVVALGGEVNDPLYDQQWALPVIGAQDGWAALPSNTPSIPVAVIDSGICLDHPDLQGRILPGYDFVGNDPLPQDDYGHGCSVAGIIAANSNNGIGIAGVAPNANILPVRVLNAQGIGTYSDVAAGIVYAADNGAKIINLSLGGANSSTVLEDAVNYAVSKGVTIVAAAGNTGGAVLYPAAYASVIAVSSVDQNLQRSSFSSYGQEVDLLAPGRDILTTSKDGGYRLMSGTSFAAPQVAGVVALDKALGHILTVNGEVVSVNGSQINSIPTPVIIDPPIITNYYYYVRGQKIPLNLSTDFVAVRTEETKTTTQTQALSSVSNYVKSLSEGIEIPKPQLTLLPLQPNVSTQSVNSVIQDLRASNAFQWVNPVFTATDANDYLVATDEFIAQFSTEKSKEEITGFNATHKVNVVQELIGHQQRYLLKALDGDGLAMANTYEESGFVTYAEPNFLSLGQLSASVNDPNYPLQWALNNNANHDINAPEAWGITMGDPSIKIAILDNGVDLSHEDLINNLVPGFDSIDNDNDPSPGLDFRSRDFHGTAVAGIAAARGNNNVGIAGVCPYCTIMPIRIGYTLQAIGGESDESYASAQANGIIWAVEHGANIINISWAWDVSTTVQDALDFATNAGVVVVVSAGNDNTAVTFPASNSNVIAVGATNICDQRKTTTDDDCNDHATSWASNFGPALDISAPGLLIYTTDLSGTGTVAATGRSPGKYYDKFDGTSSSAPFVSGVVGLMMSINPNLTPAEVRNRIMQTADDVNASTKPGIDDDLGAGRINAYSAVLAAATIDIPNYDVNALVTALSAAASHSTIPFTINLASHGTYRLTSVNNGDENSTGANGLPIIAGNITINGNWATIQRDISASNFRLFEVGANSSLTLNNLTLTNGKTINPNSIAINAGGAIRNQGNVTLRNVIFSQNSAESSGAIDNLYGTLTIINSSFLSNTTQNANGGAVSNHGSLSTGVVDKGVVSVTNSTFTSNNSATTGGAIYNDDAILTVTRSQFDHNSASQGGGIANRKGKITVNNTQFSTNTAGAGSAFYHHNWLGNSGPVTINDSCFVGNTGVSVTNADALIQLDATNNWWGNVNGPSGSGHGSGDGISDHVNYAPFTMTLMSACGLTPMGNVSGVVTAQESGLPLAHVSVVAIPDPLFDGAGSYYNSACTAADGTYIMHNVKQGATMRVHANAGQGCSNTQQDYAPVDYTATILLSDQNPNAAGINIVMPPGGAIYGHVSGTNLNPQSITIVSEINNNEFDSVCVKSDGHYEIHGIPLNLSQGITVKTDPYSDTACNGGHPQNYLPEYWQETKAKNQATPINLNLGNRNASNIDLTLERGGIIRGTVTASSNGTPIERAVVYYDGKSATTDATGHYELFALPKGEPFIISAYSTILTPFYISEYWPGSMDEASATPIVLNEPNPIAEGIDFTLDTRSISGKVVNARTGIPLKGMEVVAWDPTEQRYYDASSTDVNGNYEFVNLPQNRPILVKVSGYCDYFVRCLQPHYSDYWLQYWPSVIHANEASTITITQENDAISDINFNMWDSIGTIEGTIYDQDGVTPLPGIPIWIEDLAPQDGIPGGTIVCTDNNGHYSVENIPPNRDFIVFSDIMWSSLRCGSERNYMDNFYLGSSRDTATRIRLSLGEIRSNINISLTRSGKISGTVFATSTTTPLENVFVIAHDLQLDYNLGACTDNQGNFSFTQIPLDRNIYVYVYNSNASCQGSENFVQEYWQEAADQTTATPILLTYSTPFVNSIQFTISKAGTISGVVTDIVTGLPVEGIPVWYENAPWPQCTDENGNYTLTSVPVDAPVKINAGGDGCWITTYLKKWYDNADYADATPVTLTLANRNITGINFALKGIQGSITGTVYDATGTSPIADLRVTATDNMHYLSTCTDAQGHYTLNHVPLNMDFIVSAYSSCLPDSDIQYMSETWQETDNWAQASPVHVTTPDQIVDNINFTLQRAGEISGIVRDANTGAPLAWTPVWAENTSGPTCTHEDGSYKLLVPVDTPVIVGAGGDTCFSALYPIQWYSHTANHDLATPITVTVSNPTVNNIDFDLEKLDPPQLLTPANNTVISTNTTVFTWTSVSRATHYEIQLAQNPNMEAAVIQVNSTSYSSKPLLTTVYYWRVRSIDAAQNHSEWSETRTLTVSSPLNAAPQRNLMNTATPTLSWGRLTWALGYHIQVDNNPNFGSPEYDDNTILGNALAVTTPVLSNDTYYWRLQAKKPDGSWTGWSEVDSFVVEAG